MKGPLLTCWTCWSFVAPLAGGRGLKAISAFTILLIICVAPLAGGRGLKGRSDRKGTAGAGRPPRGGAWIEGCEAFVSLEEAASPPSRGGVD